MMIRIQVGLAILMTMTVVAAEPSDKGLELHPRSGRHWKFQPAKKVDDKLPNVLLIGDSILIGYHTHVIKGITSKANVDCWKTPVDLKSKGLLKDLRKVASFRRYDVVHFNIGLHGWEKGKILTEEYPALLKAYVATLKKHAPSAKLIWGSITQVHERGKQELNKEINPTIVRRNKMASVVMKDENVTVNDLYGLMNDKLHLVQGDRWHWKPEAYKIMGKQIAEIIEDKLTDSVDKSSNKPDAGDGK